MQISGGKIRQLENVLISFCPPTFSMTKHEQGIVYTVIVMEVKYLLSVHLSIELIKKFIKSILKSLVILAIWLALRGAIYSQIVLFL